MNLLFNWADKLTTKANNLKVVIFFLVSVFIMENEWFGQGYLKSLTGGMGMIDMNFSNSLSQIIGYLTFLGQQGRGAYLVLLGLDFLIIISFALLQISLILRLLKGLNADQQYKWFILFPIARSIFDVFETVSMMVNVVQFPAEIKATLNITTYATPLKWISLWITIGILLILLLLNTGKIIHRKILLKTQKES